MAFKIFTKKKEQVQQASTKQSTKLIVFAGSENGLFPFLTASALKNDGNDVLLIDNSQTHDLFEPVPKMTAIDDKHTKPKVVIGNANEASVVANKRITPEVFEKFDYVIAYLGYNYESEYYEKADLFVLLSDYTLVARDFMHDFDPHTAPVRLVFFNRISSRVSEKSLVDIMQHCKPDMFGEYLSLEFTEKDAEAYISFLYEGNRSLGTMTKEYQNAISTITQDIIKGYQSNVEIEEEES